MTGKSQSWNCSGGSIQDATLVLVGWCYYSDMGINQDEEPLEFMDVMKVKLHQAASRTSEDISAFLRQPDIFSNLIEDEGFLDTYGEFVRKLYQNPDIRSLMKNMIQ